jgi:hypothetical protein
VYAVEALRRQWLASGERLDARLDGLTDGGWSTSPTATGSTGSTRSGQASGCSPSCPCRARPPTPTEYRRASRAAISTWLAAARDADLDEVRPSHDGAPRTAGEVVLVLTDEQTHHDAEIGVLRDLYRVRAVSSPSAAAR